MNGVSTPSWNDWRHSHASALGGRSCAAWSWIPIVHTRLVRVDFLLTHRERNSLSFPSGPASWGIEAIPGRVLCSDVVEKWRCARCWFQLFWVVLGFVLCAIRGTLQVRRVCDRIGQYWESLESEIHWLVGSWSEFNCCHVMFSP